MHILLIILGLLLLVFGGGCTLIFVVLGVMDRAAMLTDAQLILSILLPMGLAPLLAGFFLFRQGLKLRRRKRANTQEEP